jgi:hypothetical protein
MSYEDKYGITTIRNNMMNYLEVNKDTGSGNEPIAVLFFTPDMLFVDDHFHIELNVKEAKKMAEWLNKFVAEFS